MFCPDQTKKSYFWSFITPHLAVDATSRAAVPTEKRKFKQRRHVTHRHYSKTLLARIAKYFTHT